MTGPKSAEELVDSIREQDVYHDGGQRWFLPEHKAIELVNQYTASLQSRCDALESAMRMVKALAGDQLNMHRNNNDGMSCTSRIEAILHECNLALKGPTPDGE